MFSPPVPPGSLSALPSGTGAAALSAPDPHAGERHAGHPAALQALFSSLLADAEQGADAPSSAVAAIVSDAAAPEAELGVAVASEGLPPAGEALPPGLPQCAVSPVTTGPAIETDSEIEAGAVVAADGMTEISDVAQAAADSTDADTQTTVSPAVPESAALGAIVTTAPETAMAARAAEGAAVAVAGEGAGGGSASVAPQISTAARSAGQPEKETTPATQDGVAAQADDAETPAPMPANPRIAALVEMLREAPARAGDPGQQAWLREAMQRLEAALNADAVDAADIDAAGTDLADIGTMAARFEAGNAQAGGAVAMAAALLRAGSDPQARAELLQGWHRQRAEGAAPPEGAAAAAAPAVSSPSMVAGGERAAPTWSVSAPLHQQTQWSEEIGDRVRWMVGQNIQSAELKITPSHLGAVEIRISLHKDQIQVAFTASQPAVREALEDAAPRLREMLSSAGYETVNVDVSQHAPSRQGGGGFFGGDAPREQESPIVAQGETRLAPARALGAIDFYA